MKNHLCASGIFMRDGKVLLGLRNYEHSSVWTTPGGRCDGNETPEQALLREIEEEIGITDVAIVRKLGEKDGSYADEDGRDKVMIFKVHTAQEPRLMEPEKFTEWRWFALDELPKNLITPTEDPKFFEQALQ